MSNLVHTFLFLFLFPCVMTAQTMITVSGTVTDSLGVPLSAVVVGIEYSTIGTYTNENGKYSLKVPVGRQTLIVSMVGYDVAKREVNLYKKTTCDFILKEGSINLESVTVYGKSKTQKLREGAYSMNAVDVKALANTTANLNDIINRTTGVKIRSDGGLGSDFELSLNGMSGSSVRYFIDDVPLTVKGNDLSIANIPLNTIDRVEIYKGIVPAYLGEDALGGAVNIITKKVKKNFLDASLSIGSFHTYIADINGQVYFPKCGIILKPTVGFNYSKNDYKVKEAALWNEEQGKYLWTEVKRFHDDYLSFLSQVEVGVENKSWADAFYFSGSYSKVNKELQTGPVQTIVYGMAEKQQDNWSLSLRYHKKDFLIRQLQLKAFASHTWDHSLTIDTAYRKYRWDGTYIKTSGNEITGRDRQMRHYKRPITIVRVNLNYEFNKHHSINFNYVLSRTGNKRHDDLDKNFEPTNDVLTKHVMGFSYNQSLLNDKMINTIFLKNYINHAKIEQKDLPSITHSEEMPRQITQNHLGYGMGIRYRCSELLSLKASYEYTVRLPLARELLGNGTTIYPNIALKPESSHNFNIGAFGTFRPASGHSFFYEAGAFYRKIQDYIHAVLSEANGGSNMQYDNVSNVNMKGIEGEVNYNYNHFLQLTANCSYQEARDMNRYMSNGKPSVTYRNKIPNRPWLYSNAELVLTQKDLLNRGTKLRFSYLYQYVHWFFLTWEGGNPDTKSKIPTQNLHSTALTYSWENDKYNFTVECNNLWDSKAYDNFKLQKPGRSFMCKFRLFIN